MVDQVRRWFLIHIFALAALLIIVPNPTLGSSEWELVTSTEGINVYKRVIPGSNHLAFKANGIIDTEWYMILATIADTDRATDWVESLKEMELLKVINQKERLYYSRFLAPWPLDDRDVVLRGRLTFNQKNRWVTLNTRNVNHESKPPVPDVVRMPLVRNSWRLRPFNNGQSTYIEFQAQADPGGVIPAWVANIVSKNIPLKSLRNLRQQVRKRLLNKKVLNEIYTDMKKRNMKPELRVLETKYGHLL